jgi:cell filamentation protein, protein adenylyltransferase
LLLKLNSDFFKSRTAFESRLNRQFAPLKMKPQDFKSKEAGRVVKTPQGFFAFIPSHLPPKLKFDAPLAVAQSRADAALSELAGVGHLLPNPHLLIDPLIRQEAVLSSRIEGTRASLSDVLEAEALSLRAKEITPDVHEVRNYIAAMTFGIERLNSLPLSLRLVKELHERLMQHVRGHDKTPGEFRHSQNWIGPRGSTPETAPYVPPPVDEMMETLGNWEIFLHQKGELPDLIQCAVMHEQFEAIHPFLDGNGRVGRLLITLFLVERERLTQPLLYLSVFIEAHRQEYYDLLQRVRTHGDWHSWLRWFLTGVELTARDAAQRATKLMSMRENYRDELAGKATANRLLDLLFVNPYVTARRAMTMLECSAPTAAKAIHELERHKIVFEASGRQWNRIYVAREILEVLQAPMRV